MVKVYCIVCHKRCKGDVLKIEQWFVHHKCFQCARCQKNLKQGGFFMKDKSLYCPDDYQNEFGVKCEVCHGYVEGEVVTVLGKTFHTHCFRCVLCRHLFTSGERTTILKDSYYCVSCASKMRDEGDFQNTIDATDNQGFVTSGLSRSPGTCSKSKSPKSGIILPSKSQTLPVNLEHNGISDEESFGPQTLRSYTPINGELSVEINGNGCPLSDSEENKLKLEASGLEPVTVDTLLSTTPGQTMSGGSFTPSAIDRRICPPGVDYGRHYPLSYLHLAEQGFTAVMSNDELNSDSGTTHGEHRSRSLLTRSTASPSSAHCKHLSRRDKAHSTIPHHPPTHSRHHRDEHQNGIDYQINNLIPMMDSTDSNKQSHHMTMPSTVIATAVSSSLNQSQLFPNSSFFSYVNSIHNPAVLSGRPKRDLYMRSRQLSPGSTSLNSSVMGYQHHHHRYCDPNSNSLGPHTSRQYKDRYSCRSTPNVGKRGMIQLAESLACPRRDRTLSPASAAIYWSEARRLASYPNARLPDTDCLPAIERYDFPAPPSPAVVMIDKRREKRMTVATDMDTIAKDGTQTTATLSSVDTCDGTLDRDPEVNAKLDRIDAEIETLKRLGEGSGITAALIQEFQASKLHQPRECDLDPVSASRSPNANIEPTYKTRYERHDFASMSRDTRRDRHTGHNLSYPLEYSSTGGRSGTIPSCSSTLRFGHTPGVLYGRAVSLPRPYMSADENGYGIPTSGSNFVRTSRSTNLRNGHLLSGHHPNRGHHSIDPMSGMVSASHGVVTSNKLFSPNFIGLRDGISSFTTSGLSMCGLTSGSGDDLTLQSPTAGYFLKSSTLIALPNSVTGLRPTGRLTGHAMLHHHQEHHYPQHQSDQQSKSVACQYQESRASTPVPSGVDCMTDLDYEMEHYPTVQSYLRPSVRESKSFKTYSYETLKKSLKVAVKGVDPSRLECYLDPNEFQLLFNMSLKAFQRLPEWKRNDLKKKIDLL